MSLTHCVIKRKNVLSSYLIKNCRLEFKESKFQNLPVESTVLIQQKSRTNFGLKYKSKHLCRLKTSVRKII